MVHTSISDLCGENAIVTIVCPCGNLAGGVDFLKENGEKETTRTEGSFLQEIRLLSRNCIPFHRQIFVL